MPGFSRYARQTLFPALGETGQARLLAARVAVIGCGATGGVIAAHLARAGVGFLRLVDRDDIELHNLQRQMLFDEEDIAAALPKAEAARRTLARANSEISIEGVTADVSPDTVLHLLRGVDLVLDGTDNFSTRFLLNDACLHLGIPWIYSGVVGSYGMTMTIRPGDTACLRCLLPETPAPASVATCDTAGVLAPAVAVIASIAAGEALKLLAGFGTLNSNALLHFDLLDNSLERFDIPRRADCPACGARRFDFLHAQQGAAATRLCGRHTVQISPGGQARLDLTELAARWRAAGAAAVTFNPYLLRGVWGALELTVFPDGRALIKGTDDESAARSAYARYVGC